MRILDTYISRHLLINFVILSAVLMLLFVVIDLLVDVHPYLDGGELRGRMQMAEPVAQRHGLPVDLVRDAATWRIGVGEFARQIDAPREQAERILDELEPGVWLYTRSVLAVMAGHFGPLLLLVYVFFSGLLVTAAMGFAFSTLIRHRELTAMAASGISLYRVAAPVLVVGALLNAAALPLQEYVIPGFAENLTRDKSDLRKPYAKTLTGITYVNDQAGNLLSAARFDPDEQRLEHVAILQRGERGLAHRRITAETATWSERDNGWRLIDGLAREPAIVQRDAPLADAGPQRVEFFATSLSPSVLMARQAEFYPQLLPIGELQRMQDNPALDERTSRRITGIVWSRFSLFILNVLVLVMGMPFFVRRGPANLLTQASKAACVCISVWGLGLVLLQAGPNVLPAFAAAWLPVVLAAPFAVVLLQRVQT